MKHEKLRFLVLFIVYSFPVFLGYIAHFVYNEPLVAVPEFKSEEIATTTYSGIAKAAVFITLVFWVPLITLSGMAEKIIGLDENEET